MTTTHIKVYSQLGHWFAECPCNAYCKSTGLETAFGWATDHRDEHRAALANAPAGPANFDATVHIVYAPDGTPSDEVPERSQPAILEIDLTAWHATSQAPSPPMPGLALAAVGS
jgi:hypothetical protein